ncbi:hypothetical protein U91I_03190 [alpha proteobacterium U9-1i]|nr:hypothetical protein U91I_03190 [alpha proteobacterium U9-1i]
MWGKRKHFLDPEVEEWHAECWRWLLRNLGGQDDLRSRDLVLPTGAFFPKMEEQGHARAERVFGRVKDLMGLGHWACTLVEQPQNNAQVGEFLFVRAERPAAGTFRASDGEVIITYDPALLQRPNNLIATFAHELSHYLLATIDELPPGADVEEGLHELATELAVAYHGFGIIAANGAFDFQQHQDFGRQGWSGGSWGYFSEDAWVFALAVFLGLRELDAAAPRAALKPHLARKLDAARKRLTDDPQFLAGIVANP